jgi:hypothetical protein
MKFSYFLLSLLLLLGSIINIAFLDKLFKIIIDFFVFKVLFNSTFGCPGCPNNCEFGISRSIVLGRCKCVCALDPCKVCEIL